jgi:hypothetical protein
MLCWTGAHAGRARARGQAGPPYELDPHTLETVGGGPSSLGGWVTAGKAPSTTGSSALDEVRRRARSGSPARSGLSLPGQASPVLRLLRGAPTASWTRCPGAASARAARAPPALARPRSRRGRCMPLASARPYTERRVLQHALPPARKDFGQGRRVGPGEGRWLSACGQLAGARIPLHPSSLTRQTRSWLCHSLCLVDGRAGAGPRLGADGAPAHRPAHRRARRAPGAVEVAEVRPGAAA